MNNVDERDQKESQKFSEFSQKPEDEEMQEENSPKRNDISNQGQFDTDACK